MNHQTKQPSQKILTVLRDVIFGLEDGMVSTMGALTGIAAGSADHFTVILAGLVIISVESISMGVGSYLSNRSEREAEISTLHKQKYDNKNFLTQEVDELREQYIRDGWPQEFARQMAAVAGRSKQLFLKEKAYHELHVSTDFSAKPLRNGVFMFFSYIIGGFIPLLPYLLMPVNKAIVFSVSFTLLGLFFLGAITSRLTTRPWLRSGLTMVMVASIAMIVGYVIGRAVNLLS